MTAAPINLLDTDNCIRFNFKDFKQSYNVEITINDGQDISVISYKTAIHYCLLWYLPTKTLQRQHKAK